MKILLAIVAVFILALGISAQTTTKNKPAKKRPVKAVEDNFDPQAVAAELLNHGEWLAINYDAPDEDLIEINQTQFMRRGDIVEFWLQFLPRNGEKYESRQIYPMQLYRADCAERKMMLLYTIEYQPDQEAIGKKGASKYAPVIPDTAGDIYFKAGCKLK